VIRNARYAPVEDAREFLAQLMERLDELDELNFFGPEGWREMLMNDYLGDWSMATVHGNVTVNNNGAVTVEWADLTENDTATGVDISQYPDRTVGVIGDFGSGQVDIEGSMDNSTWVTLTDNQGIDLSFTTDGIRFIQENPFYIRPNFSSGSAASVTVTIAAAEDWANELAAKALYA
jgi:hypothetical protein